MRCRISSTSEKKSQDDRLAVLEAPIVAIDFTEVNFVLSEYIQNFRRAPMNELRSQLDGELLFQIVQRVDSPADAIAGLEDDRRKGRPRPIRRLPPVQQLRRRP